MDLVRASFKTFIYTQSKQEGPHWVPLVSSPSPILSLRWSLPNPVIPFSSFHNLFHSCSLLPGCPLPVLSALVKDIPNCLFLPELEISPAFVFMVMICILTSCSASSEGLSCSVVGRSQRSWGYFKECSRPRGALVIKVHFSRIILESFAIIRYMCMCVYVTYLL